MFVRDSKESYGGIQYSEAESYNRCDRYSEVRSSEKSVTTPFPVPEIWSYSVNNRLSRRMYIRILLVSGFY